MRDYYPEIEPFSVDFLKVSELHTIYYEQCGNPAGEPILFVHGGPGAGVHPDQRRLFDPEFYRIILVDQRGCGKSTPFLELKDNDTASLVADFEKLRIKLGIKQWYLCGGSWGSTLSLVYAQTHPAVVNGLILRGIFLGRRQDYDWLFGGEGVNYLFPDYWQKCMNVLSASERIDPIASFYKRLTSKNANTREEAAKAWSEFEISICTLQYNNELVANVLNSPYASSLAVLEAHFMKHQCFLRDNQILDGIDKIGDTPLWIVHGRYDVVCTLQNAWALHQATPNSKLYIVPDAGHAGAEPGIIDRIIAITDSIAKRLG